MAGRRCPGQRCPVILTHGERYCTKHAAEYETKRGSATQRGYTSAHVALRKTWEARLNAGEIIHCARCGARLVPGDAWALDHLDDDRTRYLGISHERCNNAAGGRAAHR